MQRQKTLEGFLKRPKSQGSDLDSTNHSPVSNANINEDDYDTQPKNKKPKFDKKFQSKWHIEFDWLRFNQASGTMYCDTCKIIHGSGKTKKKFKSNSCLTFVTGTQNFQRSALIRHQSSNEHILAKKTIKERNFMTAASECVKKKYLPALESQLRTALWFATENIANRKFLSCIDFQIRNGCETLKPSSASSSGSNSSGGRSGIYTNHQAPADMQKALADSIREMAHARIRNSPFIGLMVDESLDIATNKKLVLFCKSVNDGNLRVEFCANVNVKNGKAVTIYNAIVNWLNEVGLNIEKLSGFGSDGASVMTGRISGVGKKLRDDNPYITHIWCAAHRLSLVSYWAGKSVPYFNRFQEILIAVYNFYEYSAPRYNKIRELKRIMGQKVKKFKKPTQVRWLSLQDAVGSVYDSWSALVLGLEHEAASAQNEGGAKARGICREIKTFKFITTLCLLKDILEILCKLSRVFQKDQLDVEVLKMMLASAKDTIKSYKDNDPPSVADAISFIEEHNEYHGISVTCSLRDRLDFINLKKSLLTV